MSGGKDLKGVVLESLGRILELERRVDSLVIESQERDRELRRRLEVTSLKVDSIFATEPQALGEALRSETPDEAAYRESARRLRWAAMKFINPRGRFHDLRPEIDEILRRYYPATEERLSCPPAPPPSVSAVEETSSGGDRCTAGGAYCYDMRSFREHPAVELSSEGLEIYGPRDSEAFPHMKFCPWCGTRLNEEI